MNDIVSIESVANKIYKIRSINIMLDRDLAELYGVETKVLKQAVKRNLKRFPDDFMFELTNPEFDNLRSQFEASKWGGTRYLPMAFSELGVAMLSSILKSDRAIEVNIEIMRIFTKLRQNIFDTKDLRKEIEELKTVTDTRFQIVFETLDQLLATEEKPKRKIGFTIDDDDEFDY